MESNSVSRTVFLNPNFKTTHINPNFLVTKPSSAIHINPAFLQQFKTDTLCTENVIKSFPQDPLIYDDDIDTNLISNKPAIVQFHPSVLVAKSESIIVKDQPQQQPKIISKSRTKIIRESAINIRPPALTKFSRTGGNSSKTSLIKIGTKKLIRKPSTTITCTNTTNEPFNSINTKTIFKKINLHLITKRKYKIDRRNVKSITSSVKKHAFVSRYALNRVTLKENLAPTKVLITKRKLLRIGSIHPKSTTSKIKLSGSVNKKLEMLNINGVLYKSTRNKLQKTNTTTTNAKIVKKIENNNLKDTGKRSIYIRGDKFVLDKSGRSLTRIGNLTQDNNAKLKRIDIGGLTYVEKSQNVFIRTNTHKTRNHLSIARQKSINVLSKNLVKSNIPCPIFRKVGKCAAFERGRCPKVHNKIHVNICSKFLKGECDNEKCLLSHEVTLSKMPTCKFFLQGCCVRDDCPYLHKKLNKKTGICLDFLKGFCHLAEKCNKRHEFLCPDFESTGKCEKVKCPYCRRRDKKVEAKIKKSPVNVTKQKSITYKNLNTVKNEIVVHHEDKQEGRYFTGERRNSIETLLNVSNPENCIDNEILVEIDNALSNDDDDDDDDDEETEDDNDKNYRQTILLSRRPKLGELPAFIPL